MDGHSLVAATLKAMGVTHVYGVSGTPIHETLAACSKLGIRAIGVRSQQAGVLTAVAQNYLAGSLRGVPILSAGPAVTNAVTGVLLARDNCWPLLVLGGCRSPQSRRTGVFQDLDALPIFSSLTKQAELVSTTSEIPARLFEAVQTAFSGRPGPVYLDMAEDALRGGGPWPAETNCQTVPAPRPSDTDIDRAAHLLLQAQRPAIIFGKGIRWSDAYQEVAGLVEEFQWPFVASPMARGFLPDDHPLCCTAISGAVQAEADVLLVVGARFNWQFRFGAELSPSAKVIRVDIHPPEIEVNVKPAVGLVGDAQQVLRSLRTSLRKGRSKSHDNDLRRAWLASLQQRRDKVARTIEEKVRDNRWPMSPYRMMDEISRALPLGAITILDAHVSMLVAQLVIPCRQPLGRLTVGSNGCMGVGIPYAMAAKLQQPERPVVAICGDSAFGFCAMELETAVRHRIPIIVVIANNQGIWGGIIQQRNYPPEHERVSMYSSDARYERLAESLGAHGEFVDRPEELGPTLKRAAVSGKPACINVMIDPYTPPPDLMGST